MSFVWAILETPWFNWHSGRATPGPRVLLVGKLRLGECFCGVKRVSGTVRHCLRNRAGLFLARAEQLFQ